MNTKKGIILSQNKIADSIVVLSNQHSAVISLDWVGTYKGILPCADCEGIETQITLNKDKTYLISTKYLGKGDNSFEEKGSFTWNAEGNTIILSGLKNSPNQYFVSENRLLHLDMNGNKITGRLAEKYILLKQN